jgi:DNA adenine methylase
MSNTKQKPVLRYPGSKWRIAPYIVQHFPAHGVYLEPFFGSGAVFFTKAAVGTEVVNDLDGEVANLFRVIREHPEELVAALQMTAYARDEYELACLPAEGCVERARCYLVKSWQGCRGKMTTKSGWKLERLPRDGGFTWPEVWSRLPEYVLRATVRLRRTYVENRPAMELINRYCTPEALLYVDPPYLPSTCSSMYAVGMSEQDHVDLLRTLRSHRGMVIVSGYANPLYDEMLASWRKESIAARNVRNDSRTEVLWINPAASSQLQPSLFHREEAER